MRTLLLPLILFMSAPAFSQISLAADKEPIDKPWKNPATLAYTRNGDGSSNTTIDAYLKYTFQDVKQAATGYSTAVMDNWSVAGYVHRDNAGDAKKNDRGAVVGYSRMMVPDFANFGPVMSVSWNASLSIGKSLQALDGSTTPLQYADKTKDRQRLYLSGYVQPAKSGPVQRDGASARSFGARPRDMFFVWEAGLYSDHSSGGSGQGNGRVSGGMAAVEWSVFPFGMVLADNRIGDFGVVPVLALAAQVQRDASASGMREKDTYKLYTASLILEFDTIVDATQGVGRLKPSLVISRSIGADLLGGRPYEGKTEIAFGLTF